MTNGHQNYMSELSNLARVLAVKEQGIVLYVEFESGYVAVLQNLSGVPVEVGSTIMVGRETHSIMLAPNEIWTQKGLVGVIKKKLRDVTIVENLFEHHIVPTDLSVRYEEGNTVEFNKVNGVQRRLTEEMLRPVVSMRDDEDTLNAVEQFRIDKTSNTVTFDDFGGLPQVVARARELIELSLLKRAQLEQIGARPIKGVLFTGGPGTGKTMLSRIIANATDAEFYEISGPQIFSKWYGESEQLLRALFADAASQERAIIFFDEIDSVAGRRDSGSHEASKRVVAQLLTLMDGFEANTNIIVVAATNRPQDIDDALRRPGRFDWEIDFPLPTLADRLDILEISSRHLKADDNLEHQWVAENSDGWSAAQLTAIWKEAAILAVKDDRAIILNEDYIGGYNRVAAEIEQKAARARVFH